jgi:hypothetical protein
VLSHCTHCVLGLVCSMKEACTREVEDLVFGILALTRQVCIFISTFFNVFEALPPMHVSSLLECVISPHNLDLELFFETVSLVVL